MSANFPSGTTENGADKSGLTGTANRSSYEEAKGTVKQGAATIRKDLGDLKDGLETLLSRASDLSDTALKEEYGKIIAKYGSLRYAAKGMAAEAGRQLNQGVDLTSDYVKDRPLQSVAIAAGVGLILGVLMGRH
ncbi:MAG TPA: DUF883 domain-containing protein [Burkholderiaceae bacterium]|nr:DUF883 domain-containing protein [Burkholderiaceae bacterium]